MSFVNRLNSDKANAADLITKVYNLANYIYTNSVTISNSLMAKNWNTISVSAVVTLKAVDVNGLPIFQIPAEIAPKAIIKKRFVIDTTYFADIILNTQGVMTVYPNGIDIIGKSIPFDFTWII